MDEDHIRSAWPPHSYENISYVQEYYESVMMSSQIVDQSRSIPTLIHKVEFAYEWAARPHGGRAVGRAAAAPE
jgi:hypothetical protein